MDQINGENDPFWWGLDNHPLVTHHPLGTRSPGERYYLLKSRVFLTGAGFHSGMDSALGCRKKWLSPSYGIIRGQGLHLDSRFMWSVNLPG
jgi:hypothetical protein